MNGRHLGRRRQIVRFGFSQNHKERVDSAYAGFLRIVNTCVVISAVLELLHAILAALLEFFKIAELDGLCRACFGAGRNQPRFLPVIAECALKSATVVRALVDHSKRTRDDTISATIAHIRLDKHRTHFRAHNRAGRTRFKTPGIGAMLTDIGKENPAEGIFRIRGLRPGNFGLLQKKNMPPG